MDAELLAALTLEIVHRVDGNGVFRLGVHGQLARPNPKPFLGAAEGAAGDAAAAGAAAGEAGAAAESAPDATDTLDEAGALDEADALDTVDALDAPNPLRAPEPICSDLLTFTVDCSAVWRGFMCR